MKKNEKSKTKLSIALIHCDLIKKIKLKQTDITVDLSTFFLLNNL